MSFEEQANGITVTEIAEAKDSQPVSPIVSTAIVNNENDNNTNNNNNNNNNHNNNNNNNNDNDNNNGKIIKFVVGNSPEDSTSSQENNESSNNVKEVESHRDTKSRIYKPYPAEEIVKVVEEKRQQKQKIENDEEEPVRETGNTNHTNIIQIPSGSQPSQQTIQQPTPKEEKVIKTISSETSKPASMTPTGAHQAAPIVTNTTVTITTQQQPTTSAPLVKPLTLNTPAESPELTPVPSLQNDILNAYISVNSSLLKPIPNQSPIQSHHSDNSNHVLPLMLDDSYSSEPLNYPHQPRFPPSAGGLSRTQQKLFLQRQHFLADDENYLIHPRNQLRLTKVIERINREHAAITLYRDPIIESLQRVWPKYVHNHPEVMNDDFGVEYEDAKDWGVISDHGKNPDQIISNSMISTDLGMESVTLRGIR